MSPAFGGAALALAALLQLAPSGAKAQLPPEAGSAATVPGDSAGPTLTASAGIAPDTVTVGDHFRVLLRVQAPVGAVVEFPDFNLVEPVEATDSVRVRSDSSGGWTATYPLVAWTVSDSLVATFPFRVRSADGGVQDRSVRLILPHVRSVLPADSSLHVPKPAKAVVPIVAVGPTPQGWLVPAALLLAVLSIILWLTLRNRPLMGGRAVDPRAVALARLAEIEKAGLLDGGEIHAYYVRTSRVTREYLAATAGLGEDLTTTELLWSMPREETGPAGIDELERLLREADRVKFSGALPADGRARGATYGEAVRRWIVSWPATGAAASGERAEAA